MKLYRICISLICCIIFPAQRVGAKGCEGPFLVNRKDGLPKCSNSEIWNDPDDPSTVGHCCKWMDKNDGSLGEEMYAICCSKQDNDQFCWNGFSPEACQCMPGFLQRNECNEQVFGKRPNGTDGVKMCCESTSCLAVSECCVTVDKVAQCNDGFTSENCRDECIDFPLPGAC